MLLLVLVLSQPTLASLGSVCNLTVSLSLATSQQGPKQPPAPGHGYLSGNFAPVGGEVFARDLPVEGTLPAALDGVYIRNGPNPQFPPDTPAKHHWCVATRVAAESQLLLRQGIAVQLNGSAAAIVGRLLRLRACCTWQTRLTGGDAELGQGRSRRAQPDASRVSLLCCIETHRDP